MASPETTMCAVGLAELTTNKVKVAVQLVEPATPESIANLLFSAISWPRVDANIYALGLERALDLVDRQELIENLAADFSRLSPREQHRFIEAAGIMLTKANKSSEEVDRFLFGEFLFQKIAGDIRAGIITYEKPLLNATLYVAYGVSLLPEHAEAAGHFLVSLLANPKLKGRAKKAILHLGRDVDQAMIDRLYRILEMPSIERNVVRETVAQQGTRWGMFIGLQALLAGMSAIFPPAAFAALPPPKGPPPEAAQILNLWRSRHEVSDEILTVIEEMSLTETDPRVQEEIEKLLKQIKRNADRRQRAQQDAEMAAWRFASIK
jgi:hypothetical protein